jgi:hypothetical protein
VSGVSNPTQRARLLAAGFPRDNRMRALQIHLGPQFIAVTAFVSEPFSWALLSASQQGGAAEEEAEISAVCRGVRCTAVGTPSACVSTWILVLKPQQDWPKAFKWLPLLWLGRPC